MATTLTTDVADLIPEVISSRSFDAIVANVVLSGLAEENRDLEGGPGDRVIIGTWGDLGEAIDLAENEAIVPKKFSATGTPFIVGRIGDGVSYTREANVQSGGEDLNTKAGRALGNAVARRIDTKLGLATLNGADAGNIFGDGTGTLDRAAVTEGLAVFEDVAEEPILVTTMKGLGQLAEDLGAFNAASWGGGEVIREGIRSVARMLGVRIATTSRLPNVAGVRSSFLFLPNRTLVSAYSQRPTIDTEVIGARNAVDVYINTTWAGGVQEPATLAVLNTAA